MKVLWTKSAEDQLNGIYDYIQTRNTWAAIEIYNDIVDDSAMLELFPSMGVIEPLMSEFPEEYRYLIVRRNYKIVYYIDNEAIIYVAAVFDCRQDPKKLKTIIKSN
jgi:plasmid stabilization system protein ParE